MFDDGLIMLNEMLLSEIFLPCSMENCFLAVKKHHKRNLIVIPKSNALFFDTPLTILLFEKAPGCSEYVQ